MTFLIWLIQVPIAWLSVLVCWLLAPLVAIFTRRAWRQDVVKRRNKATVLMQREYLLPWLSWFVTHDNAADEWWYGMYNTEYYLARVRNWTQADYDNSWFVRYFCRVAWLYRNPAYGFAHSVLCFKRQYGYTESRRDIQRSWLQATYIKFTNPDGKSAINVKGDLFINSKLRINFNLGYKAHKGFLNLMHAGRVAIRYDH